MTPRKQCYPDITDITHMNSQRLRKHAQVKAKQWRVLAPKGKVTMVSHS